MKTNTVFRFRIYPDAEQNSRFSQNRWVLAIRLQSRPFADDPRTAEKRASPQLQQAVIDLHKATTAITKNHGHIVVEDLQLLNMTASARGTVEEPGRNVRQKAGLSRALQDVAMRLFRILLQYKVQWLVVVPPRNTSRTCHECGHVRRRTARRRRLSFACPAATRRMPT